MHRWPQRAPHLLPPQRNLHAFLCACRGKEMSSRHRRKHSFDHVLCNLLLVTVGKLFFCLLPTSGATLCPLLVRYPVALDTTDVFYYLCILHAPASLHLPNFFQVHWFLLPNLHCRLLLCQICATVQFSLLGPLHSLSSLPRQTHLVVSNSIRILMIYRPKYSASISPLSSTCKYPATPHHPLNI